MLREGPEPLGAPDWEAAVASVEDSAAASGAEVVVGVAAGVEAAELAEARPRTKR